MPVWTLGTSCTLSPNEETTNMRSIPFVVWRCPLKHTDGIIRPNLPKRRFIIKSSSRLSIMLFSKELSVHIAFRYRVMSTNVERRVSDLNWKTILKIQETDLAHILEFAACLTNFGFLVSSIPARSPPENREWSGTDLALLIIIRLCHSHVRIVTETRLADDWEIRAFPSISVVISQDSMRHSLIPLTSSVDLSISVSSTKVTGMGGIS